LSINNLAGTCPHPPVRQSFVATADQPSTINLDPCIARWKIGNIGNIVVHQQLSRQQTGNRPATSVTSLSINNLIGNIPTFLPATPPTAIK